MKIFRSVIYSSALLVAFCLILPVRSAMAQTTPSPTRITQAIDEKDLAVLHGNVHPLARPESDQGPVADSQPVKRILLLLLRSADQEASLRQLLDDQQSKSSPNYHPWLTPEQFGKRFGLADADVQVVTQWLASHGFTDIKVGPGRMAPICRRSVRRVPDILTTLCGDNCFISGLCAAFLIETRMGFSCAGHRRV